MSINAPSDQSHRYTPVGTTPKFSTSPRAAGSSGEPEKQFQCTEPGCGNSYAQKQGLMQHYRAQHRTRQKCLYCKHRWNRPYQYRDHLKKAHELVEDDIDKILGKPAGSRRTSKIVGRDQSKQLRPPAIMVDHGRRSPVDVRRRPLVPRPAVAKITSVTVPPTSMSSVAHDLQSVFTEPTVMMKRHEYARRSEFLDASTYFSAVLPLAEVRARSDSDLNKSIHAGQIWSVHTIMIHCAIRYI